MSESASLLEPSAVSGGNEEQGHLGELRTDPIGLMARVRQECGDVGEFRLAHRPVVMVSGAEGNEWFFRAGDEELNQGDAYPFMTPIFGEGVVFDASPERRREMLHNQALRDKFMRGHAETIAAEVDRMVATWGDEGEIDLLDWFAELTIYTSSSCLIGRKFREQLDRRFAELYHDLERGTDAIAFVDPYAPIESFERRDRAREGLVALVQEIMDGRDPDAVTPEDRDLLDVLMSIPGDDGGLRFSADEVTGMFISMMFAGHHTTSGTAAWTLIELLRNPEVLAAVVAEQDGFEEVDYQALREMPRLDAAIKEALRLHPPLILLLREAKADLEVLGHRIEAGKLVGASPAVSNRLDGVFTDPDRYRPDRYDDGPGRQPDDLANPWNWIPFGAGRHRCVGAAFAIMQLKAIFTVLLRDWEFELAQPSESYRNDHSKMVVQLAQPCVVRYRRRASAASEGADAAATAHGNGDRDSAAVEGESPAGPGASHTAAGGYRVVVDTDLCQSHAVCQSEAPQVFQVPKRATVELLSETPPASRRAQVEQAVRYCPTRALSIVEEPVPTGGTQDTSNHVTKGDEQ